MSPSPPDAFPEEPAISRVDLARAVSWVLALLGFVVGARVIADNSFLTHLATGRLILETGSVPTVDPYSQFAAGEPWTVQSWLVSLIYAALDATLGGWSIRVMNGAVAAAITLGLWRLTAPARQLLIRVGLLGLTLLIGTFLWPPRPLLFGLLAMVLVLQVAQNMRPRWWLVPIFWFWVNSHGSFVLGAVVLVAIAVGAAIDQRGLPRSEIRTVATAAVGCLAGMINPLGWRLLWFPLHLMGRNEALDRVTEWASPSFRSPVEQLFLIPLVLIVIGATRRAGWRALLPALLFFMAGLVAVRNLGLASVVVVAMISPSLRDLVGTVDGSARGRIPRLISLAVVAGGVLIAATVWASAPVDLDDYPVEEVEWLEARSLIADGETRLAQRDYVGNYLTLRYGSAAQVFMDDRFDFYPLPIIDDHNVLVLGGDMAEVVDRYRFDVALWATSSPFHRWILDQPDWVVVLEGDDWFVACRQTSSVYQRCRA